MESLFYVYDVNTISELKEAIINSLKKQKLDFVFYTMFLTFDNASLNDLLTPLVKPGYFS